MTTTTSLGKLADSSEIVYALISTRTDRGALLPVNFVRQKTEKGLAIACWRQRDVAEKFLNHLPKGKAEFELTKLDKTVLRRMVPNFGVPPEEELAVILESSNS